MNKDKWKTLKHQGPIFPAEYNYKGFSVIVGTSEMVFGKEVEEMIYEWTKKLETEYVKDKTFQKNFYKDLLAKMLPHAKEYAMNYKFPEEWDFKKVWADVQEIKESKKNKTKEDRKREKDEREKRKAEFGVAVLDGRSVQLGNYTVEPPGIFMGRGKHPLRGRWKPRIYPRDVTLNLSKNFRVPDADAGAHWKTVIENKNALWTCMWYEKLTNSQKRVLFSVNSFVRQNSDQKKFEKAIELANNIEKVDDFIEKKLTSRDRATRELATIAHMISKLSIRVGDEKGADTADTVGATSLRFEHIKVENTTVIFNFLGKDSIEYKNTAENLDINAIRNIKEFLNGKGKGDRLFGNITSKDVNDFFKIVMPGLSAKQFRTMTGSTLLSKELSKTKIKKDLKAGKKLEFFTEANLNVAIKLNHQSAVSEAYEKSLKNMKLKLKEIKPTLKLLKAETEKEIKLAEEKRKERVAYANKKWSGQRKADAVKRARKTYNNVKEKWTKRVDRLTERIDNYKTKINIKEKTKGIALGTSKLNYADPRIAISWCKDNNVDVKRIYPKTAQDKFSWAMSINKSFYKKYPSV